MLRVPLWWQASLLNTNQNQSLTLMFTLSFFKFLYSLAQIYPSHQTTFLPIPFSEKNQKIVKDQFGVVIWLLFQPILFKLENFVFSTYCKMDQRMYFVVLTGKSIHSRSPENHYFFKLPTNFLWFSLRKIILNMNSMGSNTGNASLIHFYKYRD